MVVPGFSACAGADDGVKGEEEEEEEGEDMERVSDPEEALFGMEKMRHH